jgi:hypothetical protein
MSHHAIELQQAALLLKRVSAAASEVESKVYELDAKFQAHVVPWVQERIFDCFIYGVISMLYTLELGRKTRQWFDQWLAEYVVSAMEPELTWDYLALEGGRVTEVTCSGEVIKPIKKEKKRSVLVV